MVEQPGWLDARAYCTTSGMLLLEAEQLIDVDIRKWNRWRSQLAKYSQVDVQFELRKILKEHFPTKYDSWFKAVDLIRRERAKSC